MDKFDRLLICLKHKQSKLVFSCHHYPRVPIYFILHHLVLWTAAYLGLFMFWQCNYIIPCVIVIVIFLCFQQEAYVSSANLPALVLLLIMYGWVKSNLSISIVDSASRSLNELLVEALVWPHSGSWMEIQENGCTPSSNGKFHHAFHS